MFESKANRLQSELSELTNALLGRHEEREDAPLDSDWLSRADLLGSQIAPLFRA